MATYTDNNNAISSLTVQGVPGPIGYTGAAGATGAQGAQGVQGPKGPDSYIGTDIMFCGNNSGYRLVYEPKITLVGAFIFDRQEDISSVKVLAGANTKTGKNAEVRFFLTSATADSNGNIVLASSASVLAGNGKDQDSAIINLTISAANTLKNIMDPTFLWAFIKPTNENITDTLQRLSNDGYTSDEIIKYKEQVFEIPYNSDTNSLYNRLETDYNITVSSISGKKQTTLDTQKREEEIEATEGPSTPELPPSSYDNQLRVYYLKIT